MCDASSQQWRGVRLTCVGGCVCISGTYMVYPIVHFMQECMEICDLMTVYIALLTICLASIKTYPVQSGHLKCQ